MNSLLNSVLGKKPIKFVDDATGYQCWQGLNIVEIDIEQSAAVTDDPISTDQLTAESTYIALAEVDVRNGKVICPSKLRLTALCADLSTIEAVISTFNDETSTVTITSKNIISDNMALAAISLKQSGEMVSAAKLVLEFEQASPAAADGFNPSQDGDKPTYGVRIQAPPSISATFSGAVSSLTSSAKALYNKVSSSF